MLISALIHALVLVALLIGAATFLWCATNPDPESGRVSLSPLELQLANERLPWISDVLADFTIRAGIPRLRAPRFANFGAHYRPFSHRVCVSRAMCANLDDADLRLILAHEVGHASRRWRTWLAFSEDLTVREELYADSFALKITGADAKDWLKATTNSQAIERGSDAQISHRAKSLSIDLTKK